MRDVRSGIVIVFLMAVLMGSLAVTLVNKDGLMPDESEYHNLAVNIVNSNGYSLSTSPPYEPTYYREPGYVIALLPALKVLSLFEDIQPVDIVDIRTGMKEVPRSARVIQYYHVLVFAAICVMALLTYSKFCSIRWATYQGIALACFFPLAVYCTFVMRELVLTFFLTTTNFFIVSYYFDRKLWQIGLVGLFAALSALTLQVMMYLVPFIIVYLIFFDCIKLSKPHFVSVVVFIVTFSLSVSPWLIRTLRVYPDIRTVKSMGTSLTYEKMSYLTALRRSVAVEITSRDSLSSVESSIYDNGLKGFDDSFNGYYKQLADSLNQLTLSKQKRNDRANRMFVQKIYSYLDHLFKSGYLLRFIALPRPMVWLKLTAGLFSIFMAALYMVGLYDTIRHRLYYLCVYLFLFASLYYLVHRRVLPIYPYYVGISVMGFEMIVRYIRNQGLLKRNKNCEI